MRVDTTVLGEGKTKAVIIPAAGQEEEGEGSDRDEHEIEDTEPDEARGDTNVVAAVGKGPGDGVEEPEEVDPAGEGGVVLGSLETARAETPVAEGVESESQPGHGAEDEEAPLVVGAGVGADEVADDPDPGEDDLVEDGGPGDAAQQAQGDDDDGEEDDPADILGPEDLPEDAVLVMVCLRDDRPAEIRGMGEVDDGADQESRDEEVVEDLLAGFRYPDESEECELM